MYSILPRLHDFNKFYFYYFYLKVFRNIAYTYKLFPDEVKLVPIVDNKNEEIKELKIIYFPEKNDKDFIFYNKEMVQIKIEDLLKYKVNPSQLKINGEVLDTNPIISDPFLIFANCEIKIENSFKDYIKKICGIHYILRQKEFYLNIFKQIEELSQKKEWGTFNVEIFE